MGPIRSAFIADTQPSSQAPDYVFFYLSLSLFNIWKVSLRDLLAELGMKKECEQMPNRDAKSHDLFDFMIQVATEMESEYARIQKRVREDPGTAGDEGEENWKQLFRDWLPANYQIVTKGRILGSGGGASPQVDLIVLHPEYPRALLDKKVYLAAGVIAAFECKLTLRAAHINSAMETAAAIRRLLEPRVGTPYRELFSPLIYGVLAHSHAWRSENSNPIGLIASKLYAWRQCGIQHPRELLDILCVSDLGTFTVMKSIHGGSPQRIVETGYMQWVPHHITARFSGIPNVIQQKFAEQKRHRPRHRPVGSLLCALLSWFGRENRALREFAKYFTQTQIKGTGAGHSLDWPISVLSTEVQRGFDSHASSPNYSPPAEWSLHFH